MSKTKPAAKPAAKPTAKPKAEPKPKSEPKAKAEPKADTAPEQEPILDPVIDDGKVLSPSADGSPEDLFKTLTRYGMSRYNAKHFVKDEWPKFAR